MQPGVPCGARRVLVCGCLARPRMWCRCVLVWCLECPRMWCRCVLVWCSACPHVWCMACPHMWCSACPCVWCWLILVCRCLACPRMWRRHVLVWCSACPRVWVLGVSSPAFRRAKRAGGGCPLQQEAGLTCQPGGGASALSRLCRQISSGPFSLSLWQTLVDGEMSTPLRYFFIKR